MSKDIKVCISGGGPAGLICALMLLDMGYTDIDLVEQRASPDEFEKNKAFTYHLNVRGQQILSHLGCMDAIRKVAVPSLEWVIYNFPADGKVTELPPFFLESDAKLTCWTMRSDLLRTLNAILHERNHGQVRTHYSCRIKGIERSEGGGHHLSFETEDGTPTRIQADLILACDGISSPTRGSIASLTGFDDEHFAAVVYDTPSAKLRYRVLEMGPKIGINGKPFKMDDPQASYRFVSKQKAPRKALTIAAMPCQDVSRPRPINIILRHDHYLWAIKSKDELRAYIADALPQLDISRSVDDEELENFLATPSGAFPKPRYTKHLYAKIEGETRATHVILIGDSAHAFPPDLGLGVNAAFEDAWELRKALLAEGSNLGVAGQTYEAGRLPDSAAVTRLVQRVFPYQYNQNPPRLLMSLAYMLLQNKMNALMPSLFARHGFSIAREGTRPFREIEKTYERTNATYLGLLFMVIAGATFFVIS
jgi:kynurenine 3-monooxygenase